MDLSSPKIKKVLTSSQKRFSYILGNGTFLKKTSYISGRNFRVRKIKKSLLQKTSYIFSKKKCFSHILGKRSLLYFLKKREMELSNPKNKKNQEITFRARKLKKKRSEEISYILGNETF